MLPWLSNSAQIAAAVQCRTPPRCGLGVWRGGGRAMALGSIFSSEATAQKQRVPKDAPARWDGQGNSMLPTPHCRTPKGGHRPPAPAQRPGGGWRLRGAGRLPVLGGCQPCQLLAQPHQDETPPAPYKPPGVSGCPQGSQGKEQSWSRPPTVRGERRSGGFQAPVSLMNTNIYHLHVKVRFFSLLFFLENKIEAIYNKTIKQQPLKIPYSECSSQNKGGGKRI